MKEKKIAFAQRMVIVMGLLLVTVPHVLNHWLHLPDFISGSLMGMGIGMEIIGLIKIKRIQKAESNR